MDNEIKTDNIVLDHAAEALYPEIYIPEMSLSGELCTLIISVSFPFPNERYQLISQSPANKCQ